MRKIYFISAIVLVLLFSFIPFIDLNEEKEINYKLNDCKTIIYSSDNINSALERYENSNCFKGNYKLFEVQE